MPGGGAFHDFMCKAYLSPRRGLGGGGQVEGGAHVVAVEVPLHRTALHRASTSTLPRSRSRTVAVGWSRWVEFTNVVRRHATGCFNDRVQHLVVARTVERLRVP